MGQRLADQFQIIDIELDGFVGSERFVVQDIKVALDASCPGVALAPYQADPACEP